RKGNSDTEVVAGSFLRRGEDGRRRGLDGDRPDRFASHRCSSAVLLHGSRVGVRLGDAAHGLVEAATTTVRAERDVRVEPRRRAVLGEEEELLLEVHGPVLADEVRVTLGTDVELPGLGVERV